MKRHIIEECSLDGYSIKQEIAGAYGKGQHKTLNICIIIGDEPTVWYEVLSKRILVGMYDNSSDAIDAYNKI